MIYFNEEKHKYYSEDGKEYVSVTTLLHNYKEAFDAIKTAKKVSKKPSSKWYGMDPDEIVTAWDIEKNRACELGHWYHGQREKDLLACETVRVNGIDIPIIYPKFDNGIKVAPEQKLENGL